MESTSVWEFLYIIAFIALVYFTPKFFAWSNKYKKERKIKVSEVEGNGPLLGTTNLIGITLIPGYREDEWGNEINYSFFVILNMPIIPFGCYLVGSYDEYRINHKKFVEEYSIIGRANWCFTEVLYAYFVRYMRIGMIIGIIFTFIKSADFISRCTGY